MPIEVVVYVLSINRVCGGCCPRGAADSDAPVARLNKVVVNMPDDGDGVDVPWRIEDNVKEAWVGIGDHPARVHVKGGVVERQKPVILTGQRRGQELVVGIAVGDVRVGLDLADVDAFNRVLGEAEVGPDLAAARVDAR